MINAIPLNEVQAACTFLSLFLFPSLSRFAFPFLPAFFPTASNTSSFVSAFVGSNGDGKAQVFQKSPCAFDFFIVFVIGYHSSTGGFATRCNVYAVVTNDEETDAIVRAAGDLGHCVATSREFKK